MNLMGLFRSPQNELEKGGKPVPEEDAGIRTTCPHCGVQLPLNDLQDNLQVCTAAGTIFEWGPRDRIVYLVDEESFQELDGDLKSRDILAFRATTNSCATPSWLPGRRRAWCAAPPRLTGSPAPCSLWTPNFMIGSMGTVVGEENHPPV